MAPFSALPLARSRISLRGVRPRALLNITAICLLLAAATVWAQRPPPTVKTQLGRSAPSEILPFAPARKEYFLPGQKRAAPWEIGAFREIRPAAEKAAAAAEKPKPADKPAAAAAAAEKAKPADKLAGAAPAAEKAAFAANPQFELLSKVVPGLSSGGVRIVPGTVKRFSVDFEDGFRHPERYLPEVRSSQRGLLERWENKTQDKRIFVIGAGKDSAKVSEWAESLRAQGNEVFFYDFCRPPCSSEAVGALFGMSGRTMLYNTPSAELSKYVEVEVATARFLKGLDKQAVVLISTEELLAGQFRMYVANMPTPTPSAVK